MRHLGFCLLTVTLASAQPAPSLEGNWQGTLDAGIQKLRLALHVSRSAQGAPAATFDSLDQGAMGIPLPVVTLTGRALHFELPGKAASFDGTLSADGQS